MALSQKNFMTLPSRDQEEREKKSMQGLENDVDVEEAAIRIQKTLVAERNLNLRLQTGIRAGALGSKCVKCCEMISSSLE